MNLFHSSSNPPVSASPLIWALTAEKPGDNAQVIAVADAIGLPWINRRITVNERWRIPKPAIAPSIAHIDLAASDPLQPPWPNLIVTSGRRMMNVALWIKQRSPATKLVLVGRPHGHFVDCDLVVAAPQFRLPARPNLINVNLPLLFPPIDRIRHEAETWRQEIKDMRRPLTAVLVGGQAVPFRLGAREAAAMMNALNDAIGKDGSRYFVTSRRTAPQVSQIIQAGLRGIDRFYSWDATGGRNPYLALLGLADRFVVTGDSASMMVEVARLGKPLAIYELPLDKTPSRWPKLFGRHLEKIAGAFLGERIAVSLLRRFGLFKARDLSSLHAALYRMGSAVPLGRPFRSNTTREPDAELKEVGARIRLLLNSSVPPDRSAPKALVYDD